MTDLLWGTRRRPARGPKPGLSLERIVRKAIAIADAKGLAAVSMNELATRLGVGTMSLYRYVPNKEELVSLMLDTAIGAPPPELAARQWRRALARWALGNLAVFHRHPWTLAAVANQRRIGPHELAWVEVALQALAGTKLSAAEKFDVIVVLNGYVRGAAQVSVRGGRAPTFDVQAFRNSGREQEYPAFAEALGSTTKPERDGDVQRTFEFGLEVVLDGIERFVRGKR